MRLIDADALLADIHNAMCADCEDECAACQWRDAIRIIEDTPTVGEGMAEALDCFRRQCPVSGGIVCEQKKCKWRCEGRNIGLDYGYCASNNLLGDVVRLLGGHPGEGVILRVKAD